MGKIWLLNLFPCFTTCDQARHYERMAEKGLILTESSYWGDCFQSGRPQRLFYSVVPKWVQDADALPEETSSWQKTAENRNHIIFSSSQDEPKLDFPIETFLQTHILDFLVAILLPACLYYPAETFFGGRTSCLLPAYSLSALIFYAGYLWSLLISIYEAASIKHRKQSLAENPIRFNLSQLIHFIANLNHILFCALLLAGFIFKF